MRMGESYKRGVSDALRWARKNPLFGLPVEEMEKQFWTDHQSLSDHARQQAFLKGSEDYINLLKETLIKREERDPEDFMQDAVWMSNYLAYVHALWTAEHLRLAEGGLRDASDERS